LFDVRQELAVQLDDDAILTGNALHGLDGDVDINGGPGILERVFILSLRI
jgi:hypothetical protein